jgi:ATP phosphoribosyltransferase
MISPRTEAIARHAEAAQRLLNELERHAEDARVALGHDSGPEFLAAVEARDQILGELDNVVTQMTQDRLLTMNLAAEQDAATNRLLSGMAEAAARALESHEQLAVQARRERDRLGSALSRIDSPDSVATRYAVATGPARPQAFSVTG